MRKTIIASMIRRIYNSKRFKSKNEGHSHGEKWSGKMEYVKLIERIKS